ncbi:MAG: Asp-tRNA(Asn)/Glu-tRNA(Gln) amidotransferase subunit GatB [Alphaproteobacteria bacterium]|nr:Asp-tRNA(Asn)/Glu-tRNA(Gln) amidotransferase subunit GatB [Alphaproteobacteria bacterium]
MYTVNNKYEVNIGLEIHCQVISESKLMSGSSARYGGTPNSHVSFYDAAFPGQLPLINKFCIEQAIKTGLGINATINKTSHFDRKHYFYADLPSGYQITQQFAPLVGRGTVEIVNEEGVAKSIRVNRIHVEQDAAKLIHDRNPNFSYVDLNRAGKALMEIVSEPDISSPYEAGEYVKKIRAMVRWLGTCDGNMDEGSMRCDVSLSLRPIGSKTLGTRVEMKNVNSVKFAVQAAEFEAERQAKILDAGETVAQETRLFDPNSGKTKFMRSKEDAIDYKYFPDPDILPLVLEDGLVDKVKAAMPEMPDAKRARYIAEFGMSDANAAQLTSDIAFANYFESAVKSCPDGKSISNWILGDLSALLNEANSSIEDSPVSPGALAELVNIINDGTISGKTAKDVLGFVYTERKSPKDIVAAKGLAQISDTGAIEKAIDEVIASAPDNVAQYRSGKTALFGWFVGQSLKALKGQGNPAMVNEILKSKLG